MRKAPAVILLCLCLALTSGCAPDADPAPDIISGIRSLEPEASGSAALPEASDPFSQSLSSQADPEDESPSSPPSSGAASPSRAPSDLSSTSSLSSSQPAPVSSSAPDKPSSPAYEEVDLEDRGDEEEEEEEKREDHEEDEAASGSQDPGASGETLSITVGGQELSGDALDIVCRVVMNEVGDSWPQEAIKAQAVAVYTNIRRQNDGGVSPAFSTRTPSASLRSTVSQVLGEMVLYNGKPALTTFFAISAGVTASSQNVWGTAYPYLTSVESWDEEEYKDYEKTVTIAARDVKSKVEAKLKVSLVRGEEDHWLEVLDYHDNEYVKTVRVGGSGGVTTTGRNLRENILGLRSTAFDIQYDPGADAFVFTTRGYGHGVGLSQVGAYCCAKNGWDYVEILEHYYPGTQVA